jgi:RAQPRD family integrative conjugative element protein
MTRVIYNRIRIGIGAGLLCALVVLSFSALAEAEAQAPPEARIRFRYDWLREDLEQVRAGIRAHVTAARAEPRKVVPLRGDYRR